MPDPETPPPKYEFTQDWFSNNINNWGEWLGHLRGTPANALEIGSYEGRSAVWLLKNILTDPGARIACVDIFGEPGYEGRFDANIGLTGAGHKVTKLKGRSWGLLRGLAPDSFDLVYIDGSHAGRDVLEDAVLGYRLAKTGGVIVFDDYPLRNSPDLPLYPKDAIDTFIKFYKDNIEVIATGWQVCLRKTS